MTATWLASPLPSSRASGSSSAATERSPASAPRNRADLLAATERDLARIAAAVARERQPLRGKADIGLEVGAVLDKHRMAERFALDITDTRFSFARKTSEIAWRRRSTASTSCAPACPPPLSTTLPQCAATNP